MTRRFYLHRTSDPSNVSGVGVVADGVQWPDNAVTLRWRGDHASFVFWRCLSDALAVHGHAGLTRVIWVDEGMPTVSLDFEQIDLVADALECLLMHFPQREADVRPLAYKFGLNTAPETVG